jgi:hypothetical protein
MYDNNAIEGILLAIFASTVVGVISINIASMNFDEGAKKGKNEGIVYCIEKPKECKIKYDYLKLQENVETAEDT